MIGRGVRRCSIGWVSGFLLLLVALGAESPPPQIIPIRVPTSRVDTWFPANTPLRGLDFAEFERLMSAVKNRSAQRSRPGRLISARHQARWDGGILTGRSELSIELASAGPTFVPLDPWSPALLGSPPQVVSLNDGRIALYLAGDRSGAAKVTLDWVQQARPETLGTSFALGLPTEGLAQWILDLPRSLAPEDLPGSSPIEAPSADPDRSTWRVDARLGRFDLRLRPRSQDVPLLVGGSTVWTLGRASASWKSEWVIDRREPGQRRLVVELDQQLDLLSVTGPRVVSSLIERDDQGTRVIVRFDPEVRSPTTLTLQGVARVPVTGDWPILAARPLNSVWTGGQTTVKLDASRVLIGCRERAGRRVVSPQETSLAPILVFESSASGSVADLSFSSPTADSWADVRGRIHVENGRPRLATTIGWAVTRGVPLSLSIQLPTGWTPERVERTGGTLVTEWTSTAIAKGTQIDVTPPPDLIGLGRIELVIKAVSDTDLTWAKWSPPRVRPTGVRIADERWEIELEPGIQVRPTKIRGLTWIEPTPSSDSRPSQGIAWRWLGDQGDLDMTFARTTDLPPWSVRIKANIDEDETTFAADIVADLGESQTTTMAIRTSVPIDTKSEWQWIDPLESDSIVAIPTEAGIELTLARPHRGKIHLQGRWQKQGLSGDVPLLFPMSGRRVQGRIDIAWGPAVLGATDGQGVVPLVARVEGTERPQSISNAFGYSDSTDRLTLIASALKPLTPKGLVTEAVLTTTSDPASSTNRHRLRMGVRADALTLNFGPDVTIECASVDGRPLVLHTAGQGATLSFGAEEKPIPRLVILDLATPAHSHEMTAPWPHFDLPVLSKRWDLLIPEPWQVESTDSRWAEASPPQAGPRDRLASLIARWNPGRSTKTFLERIEANSTHEGTLSEILASWGAPTPPLLIDRLALASAGWSPGSRVKASSARSIVDRLRDSGLELRSVANAILLTTTLEPEGLDWTSAVNLAISSGSDEFDRLQTLDRWVETPTLGELGSVELSSETRLGPGWRLLRFVPVVCNGDAPAIVSILDPRVGRFRSVIAGVGVILMGGLLGRARRKVRVGALSVLLMGAALPFGLGFDSPVGTGLIWGSLGLGLLWIGRARGQVGAIRPSDSSTHSRVRVTSGASIALVLLPLVLGAEVVGPPSPILVLLPYDQLPRPNDRPTRAVMRLADFERLNLLANAPIEPNIPAIVATKVQHRAGPRVGDSFEFETNWELNVEESGTWSFPITGSLDLSATINDQPTSLQIDPGATTARVSFRKAGRYQLRLTRKIETKPMGPERRVARIPLVGSALAILEAPPDFAIAGLPHLGPVDRLDVSWGNGAEIPEREIQGLLLWDAEPAGDRLRVRLRAADGLPLNEIRLGFDPAVMLRSIQHPGKLIFESATQTAEGTEWVGRFSAPLSESVPNTPVELEFWRPVTPGSGPRRGPGVELFGRVKFSGMIALRRPGDWSGRLSGLDPFGIVPDFEFVRSWGELPSEALTLAGVVRFQTRADVAAAVGPTSARRLARSELRVNLQRGRADWKLETKLTNLSGPAYELQAQIDPQLRIIEVEGQGLTYWSRPEANRLQLRFDTTSSLEHVIRISGWLPVEGSSLDLAWPRVDSTNEEPGRLIIVGAFPFTVDGTGLKREPKDSYQVTSFNDPIQLRFEIPPSRADVRARSVLRIEPRTQEWISVLDYTFLDGPCESIPIQLPLAWAKEARAEVNGVAVELLPLREGSPNLKVLKPDQPIWANARVVVRGRKPRTPDEILTVPELIPLGGGQLRAMVGVINASGDRVAKPESRGLKPVETSTFSGAEPSLFGPIDLAWVVQPPASWSLELGTNPTGLTPIEPEAKLVEVTAIVDHYDHVRALASYLLKPGSTGWLTLKLPEGAKPQVALVDGNPTPLWAATDGETMIAIRGARVTQASLIWDATSGPNSRLEIPAVRTSLHPPQTYRIFHPESLAVVPTLNASQMHLLIDESIRSLTSSLIELAERPRGNSEVRQQMESEVARLRVALLQKLHQTPQQASLVKQVQLTLEEFGYNEIADELEVGTISPIGRIAALGKSRNDSLSSLNRFGQLSATIGAPHGLPPELIHRRAGLASSTWEVTRWWLLLLALAIPILLQLSATIKSPHASVVFIVLIGLAVGLYAANLSPAFALGGWVLWGIGRMGRESLRERNKA